MQYLDGRQGVKDLENAINEVINDPLESKLLAHKVHNLSPSQFNSKMRLINQWGSRSISKVDISPKQILVAKEFLISDAICFYQTADICNGNLFLRQSKLLSQCLFGGNDEYRVIYQHHDDILYVTLAEVRNDCRNKGLFKDLQERISKLAFNFYGCDRILLRADKPRFSIYSGVETKDSWFQETNPDTGNTYLYEKWLQTKNSFPIEGWNNEARDNALIILSPDIVSKKNVPEYLEENGHYNANAA